MIKYNDQLPNFIVYCVLVIGGLYEVFFQVISHHIVPLEK